MATATYPVLNADILSLSTADQTEIYNEAEWPKAFLRERLFPNTRTFQTVAVQLNYRHLRRGLAPFVWRYQGGRILPSAPESAQLIELPVFAPTKTIRSDDALVPPSVSGVWVAPNAVDYVTATTASNWQECELSHSTREEWLVAALLQTGVIDLKGDEGGQFRLGFSINPPIQCGDVDAPPVWDADMDLITWLGDQARALAGKCGIRPDTLILGSQAASIFASNKSVQAERTLLAYTQATVPQYQDAAVTFVGRYAGLDVFEYAGVYIVGDANGNDVAQDFLAPATAILACSQAAGTMTYGAISLVEDEGIAIYAAERVADSFANKGGGTWTQRVSSRYCPCPADSSSWQTFTVVAPAP